MGTPCKMIPIMDMRWFHVPVTTSYLFNGNSYTDAVASLYRNKLGLNLTTAFSSDRRSFVNSINDFSKTWRFLLIENHIFPHFTFMKNYNYLNDNDNIFKLCFDRLLSTYYIGNTWWWYIRSFYIQSAYVKHEIFKLHHAMFHDNFMPDVYAAYLIKITRRE